MVGWCTILVKMSTSDFTPKEDKCAFHSIQTSSNIAYMSAANEHRVLTLCSQGGIWASVATEGADPHRSPAPGRAVGREDLADGRPARILSPPQDHLLRGGQRCVKRLISESLSLICLSPADLDMLNERMPPRRDASESSSPVDGPRTTNSQVQ